MSDHTIAVIVTVALIGFGGFCVGNYIEWRKRASIMRWLHDVDRICDRLEEDRAGSEERSRYLESIAIGVKRALGRLGR